MTFFRFTFVAGRDPVTWTLDRQALFWNSILLGNF